MVSDSGSGTGTPITTPASSMEGVSYLSACWHFDASANTYQNRTIEARRYGTTSFTILDGANDFLYCGSESRFDMLAFIFNVASSIGTPVYEFSKSDNTWEEFLPEEFSQTIIPDYDITDNLFNFSHDGAVAFPSLRNWAARSFSSTNPHAAAPPDSTIRYWIRISASTAGGPSISQIQMRPYAYYCTASDVAQILQLDIDFDATTNPSRNTVEDYIRVAQSYIDYRTQKSWRLNYKIAEEYEFNIHGIRLQRRDTRKICRLQIWDGQNWETKTEGRTHDYFLVRDIGIVYFSRYFLLPARFTGPVWQWGIGEFNFPVRISYLYGRDIHADFEQGGMAFDLARKLAATDVLVNHDRTIITISGTDRLSYTEKIVEWKKEIDEKTEQLRGWVII